MQAVLHRLNLAQGAGQAHVRSQAGHHCAEVIVMMRHDIRRQPRQIRHPDLYLRIGVVEPLWKHAHHRIRLPVEMDLPADNRSVPREPPLEESPREHDGASVQTIFALGKRAPDGRGHPQQRKQVPAPAACAYQFRQISTLPGQVKLPIAHRGHVFKTVRLRAPVVVVGRSNGVVIEPFLVAARITEMLVEHHEAAGIAKGKRPEKDRAHNREERGSGADAQGHHGDRDQRKAWRSQQCSGRVLQVATERVHQRDTVLLPQGLANASWVSELNSRHAARFFGFHSTRNVLGGFLSQIGLDFLS